MVLLPGGVGVVTRILMLILLQSLAPVFVPVAVGSVTSSSATRFGTFCSVTRTKGGRRRNEESRSDVRQRPDVPNTPNAPVMVTVKVTMMTADEDVTLTMARLVAEEASVGTVGHMGRRPPPSSDVTGVAVVAVGNVEVTVAANGGRWTVT